MLVKVISSWTHPVSGKILPIGTELEIDKKFYTKSFLEEVKKKVKKSK